MKKNVFTKIAIAFVAVSLLSVATVSAASKKAKKI